MPISGYFKGHGEEVMANMKKEYGGKKGEQVFYATANKKGVRPKSMKKGGLVLKTGIYRLHGGEFVMPKHQAKKMHEMLMGHMLKGDFKKEPPMGSPEWP